MVNWWFGSCWFGYLASPKMTQGPRDTKLPNHRAPNQTGETLGVVTVASQGSLGLHVWFPDLWGCCGCPADPWTLWCRRWDWGYPKSGKLRASFWGGIYSTIRGWKTTQLFKDYKKPLLVGWFQLLVIFTLIPGEMIDRLEHICSNGLKAPTSLFKKVHLAQIMEIWGCSPR